MFKKYGESVAKMVPRTLPGRLRGSSWESWGAQRGGEVVNPALFWGAAKTIGKSYRGGG